MLQMKPASYYRVPGETKAYEYIDGVKTQIDYKHFNEEVAPQRHPPCQKQDRQELPADSVSQGQGLGIRGPYRNHSRALEEEVWR